MMWDGKKSLSQKIFKMVSGVLVILCYKNFKTV